MRADTAFQDEALYLWAGHLQWAHWLHGAAVPPFAYYFSGAPVIYPPLGALADAAGGLAGARILSLAFMLGATALLWATAGRLFGRRAAFFAAALFAVLGPTLHLGSFATYDAMSVFLIALAAWCVIRAGPRGEATGWMLAAGATLALANAAAYSSVLFDLVVLALALLTALPSGGRLAARRAATAATVVAALLIAGTLIGGSAYLTGIEQTTLTRARRHRHPARRARRFLVLGRPHRRPGHLRRHHQLGQPPSDPPGPRCSPSWPLAAILGPLEQAHLHTAASLNKHVGLGAWFAAIAAGYAIDKFIATAPAGRTRAIVSWSCVIALAFPLTLGLTQSRTFATSWPNATSFTAIFGPLADHGTGHLLVEDPSIAEYYLPAGTQWQRWSSTRNIILPSGSQHRPPHHRRRHRRRQPRRLRPLHRRRLLHPTSPSTTPTPRPWTTHITTDLHHNPHYHLIQVIPYGTETPPRPGHLHHLAIPAVSTTREQQHAGGGDPTGLAASQSAGLGALLALALGPADDLLHDIAVREGREPAVLVDRAMTPVAPTAPEASRARKSGRGRPRAADMRLPHHPIWTAVARGSWSSAPSGGLSS